MEYHVLASGSKGNSIFIYDQGNGLLIDCGISKRQLYTKLNQLRFHESDIHHVLLTHDHIDLDNGKNNADNTNRCKNIADECPI